MVEGAPLLREYTREGIVGSNPIFSAILPKKIIQYFVCDARLRIRIGCFAVSMESNSVPGRIKNGNHRRPDVIHEPPSLVIGANQILRRYVQDAPKAPNPAENRYHCGT